MNHTLRQRSQLVRAAEHEHNQRQRPASFEEIIMAEYKRAPKPSRADTIVAIVGVVGCVVVVIFAYVGAL